MKTSIVATIFSLFLASPVFAEPAAATGDTQPILARVQVRSGGLNLRAQTDSGIPGEVTGVLPDGAVVQIDPAFLRQALASASEQERRRFFRQGGCSIFGEAWKGISKGAEIGGRLYHYVRVVYEREDEQGRPVRKTGMVSVEYLQAHGMFDCRDLFRSVLLDAPSEGAECGIACVLARENAVGLVREWADVFAALTGDSETSEHLNRQVEALCEQGQQGRAVTVDEQDGQNRVDPVDPVRPVDPVQPADPLDPVDSGSTSTSTGHYDLNSCSPRVSYQTPRSRQAASRVSPQLRNELAAKGLQFGAPIYIRAFKYDDLEQKRQSFFEPTRMNRRTYEGTWNIDREQPGAEGGRVEVWVQSPSGRYELFKTYEVCAFSGVPGPKRNQGDYQVPEGFYNVCPGQMNPNSDFHLSFDVGYPNRFDLSRREANAGSAGGDIMMHGDCRSAGCLAMTDDKIEEIYTLAEASLNGNRRGNAGYCFPVHIYPFRMTPENMNRFDPLELSSLSDDLAGSLRTQLEVADLWGQMREGYEWFEQYRQPPSVDVQGWGASSRYRFSQETPASARSCVR